MIDPASLVRLYLLYFILPLWLLAGLSDYVLHKRTHIEDTSGTKESVLHALQLVEAGVPVILGLLFDINALILAIMLVALVAHEATALWDVTYAHTRRYIGPLEQHVHSFLEVLPIMAVSFVTVLYWDQLQALLGMGSQTARFEFRPKADPISAPYLLSFFGSIAIFIGIPYGEELWRCLKAGRRRELAVSMGRATS
ncbi:MAG: diguanylate cyclase [Nitrospira sp.]